MKWLTKYRFGFDFWGLILFLIVMLPNFILFAIDRKNLPAVLFALGFAICHLVFAIVNFIVK